MNVGHYMRADPVTLRADSPLTDVKQVMEEHGFGLLFIVSEEGDLRGFITKAALKSITDWDTPVGDACYEARFAVSPTDTVEKAALIMLANQLVLLPVVEGMRLIGVITQSEVLRSLSQALGIGLEATRFTVTLRDEDEAGDLYRVLGVLAEQGVRLVSVMGGRRNETHRDVVLRVQDVRDKEALKAQLEEALRVE